MSLIAILEDLQALPGSRLKRVDCRDCGHTLSAVSVLALGEAVADHEAIHGKAIALDRDTGEFLTKT